MSEIIEGKPQLAPGMCFICELSNDVKYIDTFRNFMGRVMDKLDGRKYVCEECVKEFAEKLGYMHPDAVAPLYSSIEQGIKRIGELEEEIKALSDVKAAIAVLNKPKAPAKKPAVAKA